MVNVHGYVLRRVGTGASYLYQYEHRIVMEEMIGRKLSKKEQVHHKNHDKTDNRPENLELIDIRSHYRKHAESARDGQERWMASATRCGKPRLGRHGRDRFCKLPLPCPHHP